MAFKDKELCFIIYICYSSKAKKMYEKSNKNVRKSIKLTQTYTNISFWMETKKDIF